MNDYLAHHGVKGQRWGVRRYQNLDGSLTEKGKDHRERYINRETARAEKRYSNYEARYQKKADRAARKGDTEKQQYWEARKASASETKKNLVDYYKNMSMEQVLQSEKETHDKRMAVAGTVAKVGVGVAATAAGLGAVKLGMTGVAAASAAIGSMDVAALSASAMKYAEMGIRAYSDVKAWAASIYIDQTLTRVNQVAPDLGRQAGSVVKNFSNGMDATAGTAAAKAAGNASYNISSAVVKGLDQAVAESSVAGMLGTNVSTMMAVGNTAGQVANSASSIAGSVGSASSSISSTAGLLSSMASGSANTANAYGTGYALTSAAINGAAAAVGNSSISSALSSPGAQTGMAFAQKVIKHMDQDTNYLAHHGVLGMKWGVRRYQPYSTTGPRKGGKTGKEVGLARKVGDAAKTVGSAIGSAAKTAGGAAYSVTRKAAGSAVEKAKASHQAKVDAKNAKKEEKRQIAEKKEHEKDLMKKAPDLATALKNKDQFTTAQLQELTERFRAEKALAELRQDEIARGAKYVETIKGVVGNSYNIIDYGSKLLTGKSITDQVKAAKKGNKKSIDDLTKEEQYKKTVAERKAAESKIESSETYTSKMRREAEAEASAAADEIRKRYRDIGFDEASARAEATDLYESMMRDFEERRGGRS